MRVRTLGAIGVCMLWACAADAEPSSVAAIASENAGIGETIETDLTTTSDAPPWLPLAPDAEYEGRSLQAWVIEWSRWVFAQTSCVESVAFDKDGSLCDRYQDPNSPVFMFAPGQLHTRRTRCVVPAGKAILVPLASMIWDNIGVPPAEQLSDAGLKQAVSDVHASTRDLRMRVDGRDLSELERWDIPATRFSYELPPEPNFYSCAGAKGFTGPVDLAYTSGFFLLFPPAPEGVHHFTYGGTHSIAGKDDLNFADTTFNVPAE